MLLRVLELDSCSGFVPFTPSNAASVASSIGEVSLQAKCSELTNYGYLPLAAASEAH